MVTLVFNAGAEALDIEGQQREELVERVDLAITLYCPRCNFVCT